MDNGIRRQRRTWRSHRQKRRFDDRQKRGKIGADEARKRRQWLLVHKMRQKGETMEQIAETMNAIGEKTPRAVGQVAQVSLALSRWNKYFLKNR